MAVNPNIKKKADDIRNKIYGKEVRESLASGLEAMSSDVIENEGRQSVVEGRQDSVESQWQVVSDEMTDKDVISAPEIISARNGEANLKVRLDKEKNEVTAQLAQTEMELSEHKNELDRNRKSLNYLNTIHFKNPENGGYSWWVYPQNIRPRVSGIDKNYFSFVNNSKETIIGSLDNSSGEVVHTVIQTDDVADEHNTAAIIREGSSGKLLVAYTKHNTEKKIYTRLSKEPDDISEFDDAVVLDTSGNATYAQLVRMGGYYNLFYRVSSNNWAYRRSRDGVNWTDETLWLTAPNQYYVRIVGVEPNQTIRVVMIGHPLLSTDYNIRYAQIYMPEGRITTVGGTELGNLNGTNLPLKNVDFGKLYDADASGKRARLFDLGRVDKQSDNGTSFAFAEFTSNSDSVYKVAKSTGGEVIFSTVCAGGRPIEIPAGNNYYFGGMWFDDDNDKVVYVAREQSGEYFVERYITADYTNWTLDEVIEHSRVDKLHRPTVPLGGGKLFYTKGQYTSFTNFNTHIISK